MALNGVKCSSLRENSMKHGRQQGQDIDMMRRLVERSRVLVQRGDGHWVYKDNDAEYEAKCDESLPNGFCW